MPLKFGFTALPGASLGTPVSLISAISALPNFEAYFVAGSGETVSEGTVSSWGATAGTGTFGNGNATKHPDKGTRDGRAALVFDGTHVLALSGLTIGTVANYTIGMRFYQRSHNVDAQTIIGDNLADDQDPIYRLNARYSSGNHFYRVDNGTVDADADAPEADGWRTLVIAQGGGQAKVGVNGGAISTVSMATAKITELCLGGGRASQGTAQIDVRSVILARSDLTANEAHYKTLLQALASA